MKSKASYLATSISLEIKCLQTSFWLIPLVGCLLDMDQSILLIGFMEAPFTMMLLPVLFGFKIRYPRYLQYPVKESLGRRVLNNGFGSKRVLIYLTCIVKTVLLRLIKSVWTVITNIKSNIYMELEHIIITQENNDQLEISCICQVPLWFTIPCIGKIMGQMTYTYGPLPSIMMYGFIIAYQINILVSHQYSFSPAIRITIVI